MAEAPFVGDFLAIPPLTDLHPLELDATSWFRDWDIFFHSHLTRLSTLCLRNLRLRDDGLTGILRGSALRGLTTVDLENNQLTAAAVPVLTDSPAAANLRWLTLRRNRLGAGLRRLVESDLIERLAYLDLRHTSLGEDEASLLAARGRHLVGLEWLDLRKNNVSKPTLARLREAFGQRVQLSG